MAALAPYLLIVAAIAAVIAIIVLCVTHWDEIKAKVIEVAGNIKESISEMKDKVVQFFTELMASIKAKVEEIKAAVSEKFQAIKDAISNAVQAAKEAVVNKFNEIKQGISDRINQAKTAVTNTFNNIKTTISNTLNAAKSTVTSIFDSIKSGIQSKINAARDAVKGAIDKIKSFMNFKWTLPNIPMPHPYVSPAGWKVGDLLKGVIPSIGVTWYAQGGVFDSPTLFGFGNGRIGGLGEAGAEAVVPLEKNTKWLDKIAERLGAGQSAQIVLQVDGKTFAHTAVSTINDLTRQQGRLALNVM
jgi:phage-related minor tail protein